MSEFSTPCHHLIKVQLFLKILYILPTKLENLKRLKAHQLYYSIMNDMGLDSRQIPLIEFVFILLTRQRKSQSIHNTTT